MKTYKLYIRFFLLISLLFLFNQQGFSKRDSYPSQNNELTFKSSQKENLQKRLRQQQKKLKVFKNQKPTKGQKKTGGGSKLIWTIVIIVVAALAVKMIQFGFLGLIGTGGGSGWLMLVGLLLLLIAFVAFFILYPNIFSFLF